MSKSKIELWVDDTDTEFAILLNSEVVSKTCENVKITKKVDQAYYLVGRDIDWKYTIDQWITFYLSNKYASLFASTTDSKPEKRKLPEKEFISSPKLKLRQRPQIKCNFCGLKFHLDNERDEHELTWHPGRHLCEK
jgi:hypothetical protein